MGFPGRTTSAMSVASRVTGALTDASLTTGGDEASGASAAPPWHPAKTVAISMSQPLRLNLLLYAHDTVTTGTAWRSNLKFVTDRFAKHRLA